MQSLIACQFSSENIGEFLVYEPFCFEDILFFFFFHRGVSQITLVIKGLQASFLIGLRVQGSLNVCIKFLVYLSPLKDLLKR